MLGDGDAVALLDQAPDIGVDGMIRHAAHWRPLFPAARAPRQRQFQLAGDKFCIFEEQFIKIAETKKEQTAGILPLQFQILLHHRRVCFCHRTLLFRDSGSR